MDDAGFGRIRSKGDQALFGGYTTQEMKNRLGVKGSRPLADFLPTLTIAAKNLATEMTNYNVEEKDLQGESSITGEHIQNNHSVRDMLGQRGIKPENCRKISWRTNRMANLSQEKRKRMLEFLQTIREEHKDDDDVLIALGEIESELNAKKYGLVWEQHEEAVDLQMRDNIPVFTECTDKEITSDAVNSYNFILEGDNLHSLRLLEKTHTGRIDLIYIDPPYNTGGKDFRYDDSFVVKEDGFRHSKWISFMRERLLAAKNLLSDKGSIFISIDDNEEAVLKLLCDDVFGEDCFVSNIAWQRTYSPRNDSKGLSVEVEHILLYSKNTMWSPHKLERTENNHSD